MKNQEEQFQIAWKMLDQGRCTAALNLYVSLPWNESKFLGVLRGLTEIGRYKEASEVADRGLTEFPLSVPLLIGKGNLSLRIEDYPTTLKCFDTALILSPQDSSTPQYGKALALQNSGRLDQAVKILDTLIEKYPDDCLYLIEKAHCFLKMGYPMDSLKLYKQALSLWYRSGQFHEGVALFTGICSVCIDLNMNKEGLKIATAGLKALPIGHPLLYYNAARGYLGMDLVEDAIATLKKGLAQFPSDKDLMDLLAEIQGDDDSSQGGTEIIFALILIALIARRRHPKK